MGYNGNQIDIPLGGLGLLTDISQPDIPLGGLIKANNVFYSNGAVEKAPGTLKWNITALPTGIVAVHHWRPTLEREYFMAVTSDGNIYRGQDRQFQSALNSTISSVLTPNCIFTEGGSESADSNKKLFLFTGGATLPYVLNGDTTAFATITSPNIDWTSTGTYPKFGVVHRNSLWAFAGQNSYASSTSNHEDFSQASASFVSAIYPGEGGELRGGAVFKGRLFAFKDGGFVYMLDDSSPDLNDWVWNKLGSNFGLAAPNAIDEVLNDLIAGNTQGTLNSYEATEKLGSVAAGDIVQELQFESFLRGNTSKVGISEQHVLYYSERKMLFATYRSCYKTTNDMLLVFDYSRSTIRPSFWIKGSPQCLGLYRDVNQIERPMYGDADGYLHWMDQEDRVEGQCINRVNAYQIITVSALLTSGTYVINYNGQATDPIAWSATDTDISNAMYLAFGFSIHVIAVNGFFSGFNNNLSLYFQFIDLTNPLCPNGPADLLTISSNTTGKTFSVVTSQVGVEGSVDPAVAYTGEFQTSHTDFGAPNIEKHFDFLAVQYVPQSTGDLSCDYFIDGRYVDTITFPMKQYERPTLGTLMLNTDRLRQANTETVVRGLSGAGRTCSAYFYNSGSNESFQVTKATVCFRPGGQKAQQV